MIFICKVSDIILSLQTKNPILHILTFDIEEWYHLYNHPERYLNGQRGKYPYSLEWETNRIFNFLEERNIKATFFWLGVEAERHPLLIRKLIDYGHEIGVHSFSHLKIGKMDKMNFKRNTEKAVKTIEDFTGEKVKSYRAPNFSLTKKRIWALEILKELGIERDSSTVVRRQFGNQLLPPAPIIIKHNGIAMQEFPVSSLSMLWYEYKYASSGYFRITPYKFLNHKMTTAPYLMSYFHPRDFDLLIHKKIGGNPYLKFKYRIGTQHAFQNLNRLSENIYWISLQDASQSMNWEKADVIQI